MSKSVILFELTHIATQLNQQLESGLTSIENCISASEKCLEFIKEMQARSSDFRSQQSLEELDENYHMILRFKRSGGNELEEDELVYTRYCTIQTHHCTRKLIDVAQELIYLDAALLQDASELAPVDSE